MSFAGEIVADVAHSARQNERWWKELMTPNAQMKRDTLIAP